MPTQTNPRMRALDPPTAAAPAVGQPYGGSPKVEASPGLFDSPPSLTVLPEADPAWATGRLSPLAAQLHSLACACEWGGDVEGHGVDFEELAEQIRGSVRTDAAPTRAPVEAKVKASTWGALGVSVALALTTGVLDHLDLIPGLLGGNPWAGVLVLALGVALPPAATFLAGWAAPHTARATDGAAK